MNYTLLEPPVFTDTLDFENVNAPFIVLNKNQYFLTKRAQYLKNFVEKLRIYTDKDEINLTSNGVSGYFKVKLKSSVIEVLGEAVIKADAYTKDDTPDGLLLSTTPINLNESIIEMEAIGFLRSEQVFKYMLDKRELLLSNMVQYSDMQISCITRDTVPVEMVTPECVMGTKENSELTDRTTMEEDFIHKTKTISQLNVSYDDINTIEVDGVIVYDSEFEEGYIPVDSIDSIDIEFADENSHRLNTDIPESIFVDNPSGSNTPMNKESSLVLTDGYVSIVDKEVENIVVTRNTTNVSAELIVSADEARLFIDDYFAKITDPTIDSFEEFKNYLKSLCDFGEDYIAYDFVIKGGKIYLGFDYNSMYSIFNSEAIKRILFENTGAFKIEDGITFDASRYFKNQVEINKLAAYGQLVSRSFDISTDSVAQVFQQIRGIIAKLCVMTPDAIPAPENKLELPEFLPSVVVVPMEMSSYIVSYIAPILREPFYLPEFKVFIITPPLFNQNANFRMQQIFIKTPFYTPDFKFLMATPPSFSPSFSSYQSPSISRPGGKQKASYKTYSRMDPKKNRLVFFTAAAGCKKRYKAKSTRTINMMELGLAYVNSNISGFYWYSKESSIVMSAPMMACSFIADVACAVSELSDYFCNFDVRMDGGQFTESDDEESTPDLANCRITQGNTSDDGGSPEEKIMNLFDSSVFELNGVSVDSTGIPKGSPILTLTELVPSPSFSGIKAWEELGSSSYAASVRAAAESIVASVENYTVGRRLDRWLSIEQRPANIVSLDGIAENIALAEYVNTEHATQPNYMFTSIGDPKGIFASSMSVSVGVAEAVYPYDNILVGNSGGGSGGDRLEYMKAPPPPKNGENKVYIWAPNFTSDRQRVNKLPYVPIDPSSPGVISTFEPIVCIEQTSSHGYIYDIAGGGSASNGREMVEVLTYYDGTADEKEYHTITYMGNTLILGPTESTGSASPRTYGRDICDPWESPYQLYGLLEIGDQSFPTLSMSSGMAPFMMFAPIGNRDMQIVNVRAVLGATDDGGGGGTGSGAGCGDSISGTSGIETGKKENISTLDSIDPEALKQKEGDTPGALSMNLNMQVAMYSPEVDPVTNDIKDRIKVGKIRLCMTFGIVDGEADGEGDILAQGLTQEEIDELEGEARTYVAPNAMFKGSTEFERKTIGGIESSVYKIQLASLIQDQCIDLEANDKFVKYVDPRDGETKEAEVKLAANSKEDEATSPGMAFVNGFSSAGLSFFYKHAGQDAKRPVIQGYQGSSEIDFIGGKRLVATVPAPIPNTTITEFYDDAGPLIDALDLKGQNYVHFFINEKTIQVVIQDTKAALSEKRTVKVMWE